MAARDVFVNQLKHKIKKIIATIKAVTGLYWESHGFSWKHAAEATREKAYVVRIS